MDPISALFASYLDLVSNVTRSHLTQSIGTDVTAVSVEHDGIPVSFSYQMWRIRNQSVCSDLSNDLLKFSECTQAASRLFNDVCSQLNRESLQHWKHGRLKNMYCNAAISFKPTIASVEWSSSPSELNAARSECNMATAALLGSKDPDLMFQKQQACEKYYKLRDGK